MECAVCGRAFTRAEHLKRHNSIHNEDRPFSCKHCGKGFGRKDAVRRHEQSHVSKPTTSQVEPSICRTCSSCAKARVKCSGRRPCSYCAGKGLDCVYRPRKPRRPLHLLPENHISEADHVRRSALDTSGTNDHSVARDGGLSSHGLSDQRSPSSSQDDIQTASVGIEGFNGSNPSPSSYVESMNNVPQSSFAMANDPKSPQFNALGQASVNWLPFLSSTFNHMPLHVQAQDATAHELLAFESTSPMQLTHQDVLVSDSSMQPHTIGSSKSQHDQVSALIASMLAPVESESPSSFRERSHVGRLYADGAGARSSQSDRKSSQRHITAAPLAASHHPDSSLSNSAWRSSLNENMASRIANHHQGFKMTPEVYEELMVKTSNYLTQNVHQTEQLKNFDNLVTIEIWEYLIQLYFEHFHLIYPFLDPSLLGLPRWGWALCLATASLGARYTKIAELVVYGELLSKTCHEILLRELETGQIDDSMPFLQARALCTVSLCSSRQRDLMDCGNTALTMICNSSLRLKLLSGDSQIGEFCPAQDSDQAWIGWRFRETRRRTSIFILTILANMAFIRGLPPQLDLGQMLLLLPSSEKLWQAESCQQWFKCHTGKQQSVPDPTQFQDEESSRLSVQDAIQSLWVEGSLHESMSPFTTEAVILMLIRRLWYAEQYLNHPFLSWSKPKDARSQIESPNTTSAPYLGADPEFAKWRNATCDCLDILHWDALSVSAKAGGFENTGFLSLHLARLLLLTPVKALLDHLYEFAGSPSSWVLPHNLYTINTQQKRSNAIVQKWCFQDRYKARLALIHAGAMFWHVRRYASESYTQPFAVYLATVVLWTYGTCAHRYLSHAATKTSQNYSQNGEISTESPLEGGVFGQTPPMHSVTSGEYSSPADPRMPAQMQLDRPMDDELVQHFIRHGSLRLCLEGVPDLCTAHGPLQVLKEGITILEQSTGPWTITERYAHSLHDVAVAMEHTDSVF